MLKTEQNDIIDTNPVPIGLQAETKISFTDGTSATVKEITENKISKNIYALDTDNHIITAKIINWFKFSSRLLPVGKWRHIVTSGYNTRGGFLGGTMTQTTPVLTQSGFKSVQDISAKATDVVQASVSKDKLISWIKTDFNNSYRDFLLGLLAGQNSKLKFQSSKSKGKRKAFFLLTPESGSGTANKFLLSVLNPVLKLKPDKNVRWTSYRSQSNATFAVLKNSIENGNEMLYFLNHATDLGLAALYIQNAIRIPASDIPSDAEYNDWDNSSNYDLPLKYSPLIIKIAPASNPLAVIDKLHELYGISPILDTVGNLMLSETDSRKIQQRVAKYIPPQLDYLLEPEFRGQYKTIHLNSKSEKELIKVSILELRSGAAKIKRDAHIYRLIVKPVKNENSNSDNEDSNISDLNSVKGIFIGSVDNGFVADLKNSKKWSEKENMLDEDE